MRAAALPVYSQSVPSLDFEPLSGEWVVRSLKEDDAAGVGMASIGACLRTNAVKAVFCFGLTIAAAHATSISAGPLVASRRLMTLLRGIR